MVKINKRGYIDVHIPRICYPNYPDKEKWSNDFKKRIKR